MSSSNALLTVGITIYFILIVHIDPEIVISGNTLIPVLPLLMIILVHLVMKNLCFSLRDCSLNIL